jgi:hypothetical protein
MVSLPSKSKLKQGDNPFIDYNTSVIRKWIKSQPQNHQH